MSPSDRQLARLLRAEEPPEPPPELLESLRREIPRLPPAPRYPKGKVEELHPRPFLGWMAAAASVVIALGASMLALRVAHEGPPPGEAAVAPRQAILAREVPRAAAEPPAAQPVDVPEELAASAPAETGTGAGIRLERQSAAAAAAPPPTARRAQTARDLADAATGAPAGVGAEERLEEAITITTETPGEDRRRVGAASAVQADELEQVPRAGGASFGRGISLRVESDDEGADANGESGQRAAAASADGEAAPAEEPREAAKAAPRGVVGGVAGGAARAPVADAAAQAAPPPPAPSAPAAASRPSGGVTYRGANPRFEDAADDRRSTFSLEAGGGSVDVVRGHLDAGRLPPPGLVRVDEVVNALGPLDRAPSATDLAVRVEGAPSPWVPGERSRVLRVSVRAREARPGEPVDGVVARAARTQVEFDSRWVLRWRLIGHETAAVADEGFRAPAAPAGGLTAGQAVTAVYEIELQPGVPSSSQLALVRLRWQPVGPGGEREAEQVVRAGELAASWETATRELRLAAAAARLGEILAGAQRADGDELAELARHARALADESPGDARAAELARLAARARDLQRLPR